MHQVKIVKRRGVKQLTLTKTPKGFRLTAPKYTPNYVVQGFLKTHSKWIDSHSPKDIDRWGIYNISYLAGSKKFVVEGTKVIVYHSCECTDCDEVQSYLRTNLKKFARSKVKEIAELVVTDLAKQIEKSVQRITVKDITSRWGSCSTNQNINLSLYLAQMPDELIEYVCAHEVAHLEHQNHSKAFWNLVGQLYPDYKSAKRSVKKYTPSI